MVTQLCNKFQEFNGPFIVTQGGPLRSTTLVSLLVYNNAFKSYEMGMASAIAWLLFLIIMTLTAVSFLSQRYWVYYSDEDGEVNVMTRETRYKVNMVLRYVIPFGGGVVMVYPLIWMIGASFMTNEQIFSSVNFIPKAPTFSGYQKGFCRIPGNDASSFHGKYI